MANYIYEIHTENLDPTVARAQGDYIKFSGLTQDTWTRDTSDEYTNYDFYVEIVATKNINAVVFFSNGEIHLGGTSVEDGENTVRIVANAENLHGFFIHVSSFIRQTLANRYIPDLKDAVNTSKLGYVLSTSQSTANLGQNMYIAWMGRLVSLFGESLAYSVNDGIIPYVNGLFKYTSNNNVPQREVDVTSSFFTSSYTGEITTSNIVPVFSGKILTLYCGDATKGGWMDWLFTLEDTISISFKNLDGTAATSAFFSLYGGSSQSSNNTILIGGDLYPDDTDTKYSGLTKAIDVSVVSGIPEIENFLVGVSKKDGIIHQG